MLNTMASFVILLIARSDRHTDRHTHETTERLSAHARRGLIIIGHTDNHTHETTTVTLSAHAHRGLIIIGHQLNSFNKYIIQYTVVLVSIIFIIRVIIMIHNDGETE